MSYTKGTSTEDLSVWVNEEFETPVTDNLFRAMRAPRRRYRARTICIDAIAINQADVMERNQQVTLMDVIYTNASCVNAVAFDYWSSGHRRGPVLHE